MATVEEFVNSKDILVLFISSFYGILLQVLLILGFSIVAIQFVFNFHKKRQYKQMIIQRQNLRKQHLKEYQEKLNTTDDDALNLRLRIVELSVEQLLQELKDGAITATQTLQAFQAKALEANTNCNCVVQFIMEAEDWASNLDSMPSKSLPLHGLPVSLKEEYAVYNYDVTLGLGKFVGNLEDDDAVIVTALKKLGAIPFCRTNTPQTCYSFCCGNPIYGSTRNPKNLERTCGGSTGGEGALIASRGSIMGFGSDLAGSLRVPAHFCGIASLKPTSTRFSRKGVSRGFVPTPGVAIGTGILGRDVSTVTIGTKALIMSGLMSDLDPLVVPLDWKESIGHKKLRIGYYEDSIVIPTTPGCKRAVQEAVKALRNAGHDVFLFPSPVTHDAVVTMIKLSLSDNGKHFLGLLKNEPVIDPEIYQQYLMFLIPEWLKYLLKPIIRLFTRRADYLFGATRSTEVWTGVGERHGHLADYLQKWNEQKLDVCIGPGLSIPAVQPEYPAQIIITLIDTMIYNFFDFPVGVVPVSKETAEDQRKLDGYDTERDIILKTVVKATRGAEGLPLGVQVVGLPWQEELVLHAMKELEEALKSHHEDTASVATQQTTLGEN